MHHALLIFVITGKVFAIHSNPPALLYHFKKQILKQQNHLEMTTVFHTPDHAKSRGKIACSETGIFETDRLVRYEYHEYQADEHASATAQSGKLILEYERNKKKSSTRYESFEPGRDTILTPINIAESIVALWTKGSDFSEPFPFRLFVPMRQETFDFRLSKLDETPRERRFIVRPQSLFLKALLNPIEITFDKKKKYPKKVVGRMPVKILKNGDWVDLDANLVVDRVTQTNDISVLKNFTKHPRKKTYPEVFGKN